MHLLGKFLKIYFTQEHTHSNKGDSIPNRLEKVEMLSLFWTSNRKILSVFNLQCTLQLFYNLQCNWFLLFIKPAQIFDIVWIKQKCIIWKHELKCFMKECKLVFAVLLLFESDETTKHFKMYLLRIKPRYENSNKYVYTNLI